MITVVGSICMPFYATQVKPFVMRSIKAVQQAGSKYDSGNGETSQHEVHVCKKYYELKLAVSWKIDKNR